MIYCSINSSQICYQDCTKHKFSDWFKLCDDWWISRLIFQFYIVFYIWYKGLRDRILLFYSSLFKINVIKCYILFMFFPNESYSCVTFYEYKHINFYSKWNKASFVYVIKYWVTNNFFFNFIVALLYVDTLKAFTVPPTDQYLSPFFVDEHRITCSNLCIFF